MSRSHGFSWRNISRQSSGLQNCDDDSLWNTSANLWAVVGREQGCRGLGPPPLDFGWCVWHRGSSCRCSSRRKHRRSTKSGTIHFSTRSIRLTFSLPFCLCHPLPCSLSWLQQNECNFATDDSLKLFLSASILSYPHLTVCRLLDVRHTTVTAELEVLLWTAPAAVLVVSRNNTAKKFNRISCGIWFKDILECMYVHMYVVCM